MSAIFKERKVPRHLIIQDEYELRAGPRRTWGRFLLLGLAIGAVVLIIVNAPNEWLLNLANT